MKIYFFISKGVGKDHGNQKGHFSELKSLCWMPIMSWPY